MTVITFKIFLPSVLLVSGKHEASSASALLLKILALCQEPLDLSVVEKCKLATVHVCVYAHVHACVCAYAIVCLFVCLCVDVACVFMILKISHLLQFSYDFGFLISTNKISQCLPSSQLLSSPPQLSSSFIKQLLGCLN